MEEEDSLFSLCKHSLEMVLTRFQAKQNIENNNNEPNAAALMVMNDPPLLTISRSRLDFDDEHDENSDLDKDKDRTIQVGNLLEQLNE
ncbi:hypothetical protein [Absidia glauca]|uniref:Uncharacterized protein n=1 Tax=Absidia glauca TaxID=4829 RepID=A0A168MAS6_ABSGL|nr:hypothetical protein [Absidia glauca]